MAMQKIHHRKDHAGGTEAALNGSLLHKGPLYRMEFSSGAHQSFGGKDEGSLRLQGEYHAGFLQRSIHDHRTGAALSLFTPPLYAGNAVLPKSPQKGGTGLHLKSYRLAIQGKRYGTGHDKAPSFIRA
jgi:hypothetical protein